MLGDWGLGQDVNRLAKSGNSSAGFVTVGPSILCHRCLPDILSRVPIPSRLPSCYTQAPKYAIGSTMTWKCSFGLYGLYALTLTAPSTIVASRRRPPPIKSHPATSSLDPNKSPSETRPVIDDDDDPLRRQLYVPEWARPGIHKLDRSSIATAKNCIGPAIVGALPNTQQSSKALSSCNLFFNGVLQVPTKKILTSIFVKGLSLLPMLSTFR